ncbi:MAG TPA: hypothetical protein VLZ55_05850 [Rhodanobacter sp.]|nr:hypothetical protein [Rhodanobacter sp.]
MTTESNDIVARKSIFAWIALATGAVLLIPLIAMQFTGEVNWDATDFLVMGCLLFSAGSAFVLAARRVPRKYRVAVAVVFVAALVYVWVELAVGVFTNLGS